MERLGVLNIKISDLCQYSKTTSSIVSILDCGEMIEQLETDQDLSPIKKHKGSTRKAKG